MLGGLYGDLPPPSSVSTSGNEERNNSSISHSQSSSTTWSSSAKMAPPALRKPSHLFTPPPSVMRNQQSQGRSKTTEVAVAKSLSPVNTVPSLVDDGGNSANIQLALVGMTATIVEEYDPARPNDYEEYRREKKKRLMEVEMKRELERRQQEEEERERERERELEREREAVEREKEHDYESRSSVLNISGEEAWKRRAAMSSGLSAKPRSPSPPTNGDRFTIGKSSTAGLGVGAGGQMTAAQKMMAKMGWKEGQGLGKQEQGITTPLMAKKTDRRAGVIVNASETRAEKKPKSVNMNGPPTRVLLLRNMVGPGQVDDDLEGEVADECAKHGPVTRVLIFEITEPGFPDNEAVRIFVQFERAEGATRAFVDLEGRYFGGRTVHASFYDEDRFSRNELAPTLEEISGYN